MAGEFLFFMGRLRVQEDVMLCGTPNQKTTRPNWWFMWVCLLGDAPIRFWFSSFRLPFQTTKNKPVPGLVFANPIDRKRALKAPAVRGVWLVFFPPPKKKTKNKKQTNKNKCGFPFGFPPKQKHTHTHNNIGGFPLGFPPKKATNKKMAGFPVGLPLKTNGVPFKTNNNF